MCCDTHKTNAISYSTNFLSDDVGVQNAIICSCNRGFRAQVTFALAWSPVKSTERLTPFTVAAPALAR